MTPDDVRAIFQEMFDTNYSNGAPKVPPHLHNGVDNLKINVSDLSGSITTKPAGINGEIQFNDNGAFGGDTGLTYTKATGTLGVHDINNNLQPPDDGFDLSIQAVLGTQLLLTTSNSDSMGNPLGNTGNIVIQSDDIDSNDTGDVTVKSGNSTTSGETGDLILETGTATGTTKTGKIILATGNSSPPNNGNGSLTMYSQKNIDMEAVGTASSNVFIYATGTNTLNSNAVTNIQSNSGVTNVSSGNGTNIKTLNVASGATSANVDIFTGDTSGAGTSGDINITTGAANTSTSGSVGNISLKTPAQSSASTSGSITLNHANGAALATLNSNGVNEGFITLDANIQVSVEPYRGSTVGNMLIFFKSGSTTALNNGGIYIGNAQNTPSGTPTNGGVLYVSAGALHWLGSSGTDTIVAVA